MVSRGRETQSIVILRMRGRSLANDSRRRISALDSLVVTEASATNCHPDRSFSSPEGMRRGVEGLGVSARVPRVPHSLRFPQGAGACAESKTQAEDATVNPPAPYRKRKEWATAG